MRLSLGMILAVLPALLAGPGGCAGGGASGVDGGDDVISCASRLDCPGRLGCVDGICGRCTRDRDCLVTEMCHPLDNLCHSMVEGDECRLNQDCPLGWFCVQGYCEDPSTITPCTEDADCGQGERCDPLNLVCVEDLGCNRDEDCAAGEVCDLATNRCTRACTPETQESVCGYGLVCDENGRCVECYRDDQCGVGLDCNTQTNRCEGSNSCMTNRDCLPGQVCNPQTRQCTEPPPSCLSNADCAEGSVCDPATGQCVPADCRPDPFESNDSPAEAAPLGAGRVDELTLCPGDLDWYAVDLARGDRLMVIVNTDFLAADHFQTVLFDPRAEEILQEDSLLIDHTVAEDAPHLLRCQTTDPRADYDLVVTISRGIPCDDDAFEPNDSAYDPAVVQAGVYTGLALCPHDEDWYLLERPPDMRLEVRIEYPAIEGDLDLELVASDARTVVDRSATAGDFELVSVGANPGTRFYVRVYAGAQTANRYEMTIAMTPR